jgi:hypothetical protein
LIIAADKHWKIYLWDTGVGTRGEMHRVQVKSLIPALSNITNADFYTTYIILSESVAIFYK